MGRESKKVDDLDIKENLQRFKRGEKIQRSREVKAGI